MAGCTFRTPRRRSLSRERSDEGERLPVELEEGQRILYGKYSGTEVNIDGHDLLIIKESDVLAIID